MNRTLYSFLFVCFVLTSTAQQWKNYTSGLNVNCIAIDHDTVWIGSEGGVAKYLTNGTQLATYTKVDGLASDDVVAIAIDWQGNKWFGTGNSNNGNELVANGVSEFDGANWTNYNSSNSGLVDNAIYSIVIDRQGNKWFNFTKYDGTNWTAYPSADSALVHGFTPTIDSHGDVWYYLTKYDGTNLTYYQLPSYASGLLYAYAVDSHDNLWISLLYEGPGSNPGLYKFDGTNWFNYDSLSTDVSALIADKFGNIWFNNGSCISSYSPDGLSTFCDVDSTGFSQGDPDADINTIALDSENHLWMGCSSLDTPLLGGVYKFDSTNWTHFYPSNSPLIVNGIRSIAIDHENNKWIAENNFYASNLLKFDTVVWTSYNLNDTFSGIGYIYIDNNDNKWFTNGRLMKLDGTTWSDYSYPGYNPNNSLGIYEAAVDQQGVVWCIAEAGMWRFDGSNWTEYNGTLYNGVFARVAVDQQNNKWFTGWGVTEFDGLNWTSYTPYNSSLPDSLISALAIDRQGNKWFGTISAGVAKFDGINWTVYDSSNSGLPGNEVISIAIDNRGNKWFAVKSYNTSIGVAKFDGSNWTLYSLYNSGLSDNCVNSISADEQDNIWFGTCDGGIAELMGSDTTFRVQIQFTQNCHDSTVTLTPVTYLGTGPLTYSWQSSGRSLSCNNCQYPIDTVTESTTFIVQVTDSNNITVTDTLVVNPCIPAGINNVNTSNSNIIIYPNPFTGNIFIQVGSEILKKSTFKVYNMLGQTVYSKQENYLSPGSIQTFNLSYLANGIYTLEVDADGERTVKKIIKQQ